MAVVYDVFWNAGAADAPIDYSTPLASGLTALTFSTRALARSSTYLFGVRARDTITGLSESNVDAVVKVVIDANGNDVSAQPLPAHHLTALPLAAGKLQIEWAYPYRQPNPKPKGFRVYIGTGPAPDYSAPVATASYLQGQLVFRTTIGPLVGGQAYTIGVRAFTSAVEETNTDTISATPISQGPASVQAVTIQGTSQS